MKRKIFSMLIVLGLISQSCGDEHVFFPQVENVASSSPKVKFIHAASDTVGVNLFLDDLKITGSAPSTITTFGSVNLGKVNVGTITFSNTFPVTNYTNIGQSSGTLSVVFPETYNATTTFLTKTMSTAPAAFEAGEHYTVAFVGVSPNYETIIYNDNMADAPIDGKSYIRFANFIHNSADNLTIRGTPPVTAEDPAPVPIEFATSVAYKGMSGFVALPRTGAYTNVQIVNATTGAVITTLATANSTFADNKVYTIFARGRIGGPGTAAPTLTRIINR